MTPSYVGLLKKLLMLPTPAQQHVHKRELSVQAAASLADLPAEEQKQALLDRDYNRAIDLGGNVYFLSKLFFTDGKSFLQAVGTMTGMSAEDYQAMMIAGGRSPDGVRSIRDGN